MIWVLYQVKHLVFYIRSLENDGFNIKNNLN